jgi:hypothetical protein
MDDGKLSDLRASSNKFDKLGRSVASVSALLSLATKVSSSQSIGSEVTVLERGPALLDRGDGCEGGDRFDFGEILGVRI